LPILSASPAAITDAEAGTYIGLDFAGSSGVSAVAFTIFGDAASEFNITIDTAGSDAGQRDSGNRSIGDLITVEDGITGTVTAGGGDDLMRMQAGVGNHSLDGGDGNDALYGNAGNDTLNGGTGNNFLSGAAGSDVLIAGAGQRRPPRR
jgi:Ca2+-binding RTX toxin-like protein